MGQLILFVIVHIVKWLILNSTVDFSFLLFSGSSWSKLFPETTNKKQLRTKNNDAIGAMICNEQYRRGWEPWQDAIFHKSLEAVITSEHLSILVKVPYHAYTIQRKTSIYKKKWTYLISKRLLYNHFLKSKTGKIFSWRM